MEKLTNLKNSYDIIKKKFNLPEFDELDSEFEIRALDIEKSGILIKALLRIILSKLAIFLNYLEPIISPNPQSYHSMVELNNLSDDDKHEIFDYYKSLSSLYHEGCAIELKSEKEVANFIKKIYQKWPELKRKEIYFLDKITQTWLKEKEKEKTTYTG